MTKNHQNIFIVLIMAGVLAIMFSLPETEQQRRARVAQERAADAMERLEAQLEGRPMPKRTSITLANYHRIQDGMSYDQVARILDLHGEELSRSSMAGYTTVMYAWKNPNGSNMNAMFQNDRLVSKAQFGLE